MNSITFFSWNSMTLNINGRISCITEGLPIGWHDIEHLFWGHGFSLEEENALAAKSKALKEKIGLSFDSPAGKLFQMLAFDTLRVERWFENPTFPKTFYLHEQAVLDWQSPVKVPKLYLQPVSFTREQLIYELAAHHGVFVQDILDDLFYTYDTYKTLVVYAGFYDEHSKRWVAYPVLKGVDASAVFTVTLKAN